MERKSAYDNLAKWFEYLNDDCGYENWSQYLLEKLRAFSLAEGLDVGCGGGWFTRSFAKAGYWMTGLDISDAMLTYAREKALQEGVRGEYLLGDITRFTTPKKYDFVTAINDCFNYVEPSRLAVAFQKVKSALKKGGIFLFDLSSPRKINEKIANTVSVDDRDDVTYLSFATPETDGVTMDVTLFSRNEDGSYTRLDERHRQYIHTVESVQAALENNGFTVLEVEGHLGEDLAKTDRISFLAQKN